MQSTCADWATQLQNSSADKPLMSWPPKKPPQDPNGYTKGYQGAKEVCIQTQGQMFLLDSLREATPEELDLIKLTDDCNELMRQKQLRDECNSFFLAKKALQNQCATASDIPKCQDLRNKMNSLCAVDNKQYASQACENNKIPDLLNIDYAKQEQVDRANVIKRLCIEAKDIRTPLGEIMKVFSILTGIQSGTAAHGGLVTSIKGSQAFYQNVKKFITMIEGLKGAMTKKYNETVSTKAASGGADIEWFKCVAAPAESQAGGKKTTGPKGGLVCPQVKTFFTQLQAQFAQIRQELHALDKARRKTESADLYLPWDEDKYIHLYDKFPVAYESITPMYERAEQLKKEAQFVWALATALNFANENCACGMSYCKLPFCISGLPLTLSPLKDPYCVLVWILRSPMVNMAERLAKDLDAKLECK